LVLFIIHNTVYTKRKLIDAFAAIGKRSLSIYLWHQVFIAYMYYALVEKLTIPAACILFLTIGIISAFSYRFIEIPLSTITSKGKTFTVLLPTFAMCIALIATGFIIYLKAGVIRNVPELGITTDNIQRGMHAAYCDIPYSWDRDFTDSQKTKILVVGNSFARDWANILNESTFSDDIEISYFFLDESNFKERIHRIEDADYVFYALGPDTGSIPQTILNSVPEKKLYIVGNKNFGSPNGIVYAQRYKDDYFDSAVHISEDIISHNAKYKELYNNHYIDLITPVQNTSDMIFVFTDTNHFISQDTLHLTKYGAQYYARILDFSWLIMD